MSPDDHWLLIEGAFLRRLRLGDSARLFRLIEDNRERLRPWLPWVDDTRSTTDVARFISESQRVTDSGPVAVECAVETETALVAAVGLNQIDWPLRTGNLGYWVDGRAEGRGLVTASVRRLAEFGFRSLGLLRIEIRCAADNERSRRVAERAGFTLEGTLRSAVVLGGVRRDLVVYGCLPSDHPPELRLA